ncbi:MAG TPA: glycoside hydrolase family 2 protein, partial [Steroidobacteraceae bacterium]|nr:glycoside hydrolase family 2 protein [Steroidobacteraceae bacterium]
PMVANQRLNAFRTTLLGRTPGWSPPAAPVGPWRPIWLQARRDVHVGAPRIRTYVQGDDGLLELSCEIRPLGQARLREIVLVVSRGNHSESVRMTRGAGDTFAGRLRLPSVDLWWPHTHGEPALYAAHLEVLLENAARGPTSVDLGKIGFRNLEIDRSDGDFAVRVNGLPIFCRGACWTPLDCVSLQSNVSQIETALSQVCSAGMNMLRVGGTMVYESDAFLDACDAHGILLWQDFMFANMDYPQDDAAFDRSVTLECTQQLERLAGRPSLAVLCGNSEGEQQAAMWGAPRERWSHPLSHRLLPALAAGLAPDVTYWPSSAHGGAFPHQTNVGTVSYYGVGAYLRPLTDARRAEVRFATECLAFANVPSEEPAGVLSDQPTPRVHSPEWKARVPRDLGAGWDFDDVRDHYLRELFGVDPNTLRYAQHDRYLALSRIVSGEVMGATFREWRRQRSTCQGALIWFLRDLWAGAGWGIVAANGIPKAPYYALKHLLQPRTVFMTDEGCSGLFVHIANEGCTELRGSLEISLYRQGHIKVGTHTRELAVPARTVLELPAASLLEGFVDLTYAYRFGAPTCDVVCATLSDPAHQVLARDFYFPLGHREVAETDIGLTASATLIDGGAVLRIQAARVARFVTIEAAGFIAADQYFHLLPGIEHQVHMRAVAAKDTLRAEVRALNGSATCKVNTAA